MANDNLNSWGLTGRAQPSRYTDENYGPMRRSARGDAYVLPLGKPLITAADEGAYFFGSNPTPGTGILGITAADGFDATETLFLLTNGSAAAEAVRVYPDFLELACTVVDANGTNIRYDVHMDNIARYTSGGSAITPVNCNMDSSASPKATLKFGAIISPAASTSVRYLGGRLISSTDLVANDTMRFDFGSSGGADVASINYSEEATLARRWSIQCPPVVLGPGCCLLLSINCASQATTGVTWSFNCGWFER